MPRWTVLGLFLLGQSVLIFILPLVLVFLWDSSFRLDGVRDALSDREYLMITGLVAFSFALLQAGFLTSVRPVPADSPGPGLARSLAFGLAVGVMLSALLVYAAIACDEMGGPRLMIARRPFDAFWITALALGLIAAAMAHTLFRDGIPVGISLVIAGLLAGMLTSGVALGVVTTIELIRGEHLPERLWQWALLPLPIVCWGLWTPLLIAFMRKGPVESRLSKLASRLFIGSLVETVATVPLAVMVRRKSDCYCSEGAFWSMVLSMSVGVIVLGPAMYLLPLKRRQLRLAEGRCRACGYDMGATPKAERCPECGAGWRPGPTISR